MLLLRRLERFNGRKLDIYKSLEELKNIQENGKGDDKRAVKLGVSLLENKKVTVLKSEGDAYVDDLLVDLAKKGCIIATLDKGLQSRLDELNVPTIILRQKKYIVMRK